VFVLVDQSSQYRSAFDPAVVTVRCGVIGARRDTFQCSVRPPAVVAGAVPGKDGPQVSLAKDQDAVGELGSGGQDESFGEAVRSQTSRWDLYVRIDDYSLLSRGEAVGVEQLNDLEP
jgi:hypothetical protein